jgi:hypothetical protein
MLTGLVGDGPAAASGTVQAGRRPRVDGDRCHGRSMDDAEQTTGRAVAGPWITLPRVGVAVPVASVGLGLVAGLIVVIAGARHWIWRARAREAKAGVQRLLRGRLSSLNATLPCLSASISPLSRPSSAAVGPSWRTAPSRR